MAFKRTSIEFLLKSTFRHFLTQFRRKPSNSWNNCENIFANPSVLQIRAHKQTPVMFGKRKETCNLKAINLGLCFISTKPLTVIITNMISGECNSKAGGYGCEWSLQSTCGRNLMKLSVLGII